MRNLPYQITKTTSLRIGTYILHTYILHMYILPCKSMIQKIQDAPFLSLNLLLKIWQVMNKYNRDSSKSGHQGCLTCPLSVTQRFVNNKHKLDKYYLTNLAVPCICFSGKVSNFILQPLSVCICNCTMRVIYPHPQQSPLTWSFKVGWQTGCGHPAGGLHPVDRFAGWEGDGHDLGHWWRDVGGDVGQGRQVNLNLVTNLYLYWVIAWWTFPISLLLAAYILTSKLNSAQSGAVIRSSIVSFRKGGCDLTGPT